MKLLHTSDFHLGVRTEGRNRSVEQRRVLHEICEIADQNDVDVVVVAGDVFQKATPSAEAEDIFFEFVEKIAKEKRRVVLVLAGNHDDPKRLAAGSYLAEKHNIVLASDLSSSRKIKPDGKVQIVDQGPGFVKIQKGTEKMVLAFLPYATDSRIDEKTSVKDSFPQKVQRWAKIGASHFEKDAFNVFASHLYVVGAKIVVNDKEANVKLGEAFAVPKDVLPKADYVALGHLHEIQCLDAKRNVWYSGAPIPVRFHESEKFVIVAEKKAGEVKIEKVRIENAAIMRRISASSINDAFKKLEGIAETDIVELSISQSEPLLALQIRKIKRSFPCVAQVKLKLSSQKKHSKQSVVGRKDMNRRELFRRFCEIKTGAKPSTELEELFLRLCFVKEEE